MMTICTTLAVLFAHLSLAILVVHNGEQSEVPGKVAVGPGTNRRILGKIQMGLSDALASVATLMLGTNLGGAWMA